MTAVLKIVEHDTFAWWEQVLGGVVIWLIAMLLAVIVWRLA